MRFLVIESEVEYELDEEGWESVVGADVKRVIFCETTRDVAREIMRIRQTSVDWSLFEIVGGKAVRRAAIMRMDGSVVYDVTIC